VAQADIIIADEKLLPRAVELRERDLQEVLGALAIARQAQQVPHETLIPMGLRAKD